MLEAERRRVETIARVSPSVVCMFDENKHGGGSGVLISPDGYGLTNYHVIAGMLDSRRGFGGLGDGVLYEMEILGIDPTGDVAMFRLTGPGRLPYAPLGDSGALQLGDTVMPIGNPFVMSEDYSPTVTLGIVTGLHRYQWGVKGNLTYSDCIQTDAAINPGNSGGPLFNLAGEIVGINGRISVNTRGRYNVGFGYAISSNQVRRFVPALRAGRLARHGTLLATVEEAPGGGLRFDAIASDSPLVVAGVHIGDRLIAFDGIELRSPNHYVSVLGAYPEDWPVPVEIEQDGERRSCIVRLLPVEPKLRKEFTVDREANLREVRRILNAYRAATWDGDPPVDPGERDAFVWTLRREFGEPGDGAARTFAAAVDDEDRIRLVRQTDEGASAEVITFDSETATRRKREGVDAEPLPTEWQMYYAAVHLLTVSLPALSDESDLSHLEASGADFPAGRSDLDVDRAADPWEVLTVELPGHKAVRFSFDPATGHCMRARVTDVPTGSRIVAEFMQHRPVGGRNLPGRIEVRGPTLQFRDMLSEGEPGS